MLPVQMEFDEQFFKEETRNGFFITRQRKEIWAIELDLLFQFDKACKKHNLAYFLCGGTLLGAVRHKGFIPWDDDIDVEMFREDYDKLLRIAKQEFEYPYFFQSAYSDKGYFRGHSQLRNSSTCGALLNEAYDVKFNQGIFLDIFVLDGVAKDREQLGSQLQMLRKYSRRMRKIGCPHMYNKIKYILKLLRRWFYIKTGLFVSMYRKFEDCARRYQDEENVFYITFYKKMEEIKLFSKKWYDNVLYVSFESLKCPIPSEYNEILSAQYGEDFMVPKNVPNEHGELILDTRNSYIEVLRKRKI